MELGGIMDDTPFINGGNLTTEYVFVHIGCNDSNKIQCYRLDVHDILEHGTFVDDWEE
jgi:hypothetical protein